MAVPYVALGEPKRMFMNQPKSRTLLGAGIIEPFAASPTNVVLPTVSNYPAIRIVATEPCKVTVNYKTGSAKTLIITQTPEYIMNNANIVSFDIEAVDNGGAVSINGVSI